MGSARRRRSGRLLLATHSQGRSRSIRVRPRHGFAVSSPRSHDHDPHRLRRGARRDDPRHHRLPARPPFRAARARTGWPRWPPSSTSGWRRWSRDLSAALERAQQENRRTRVLGELGGTIDLDEVLTRTLDATGALGGVDAAVVSVAVEGDAPADRRRSASGPSEPAAAISGPPDGSTPRSIAISYEYGPAERRARRAWPDPGGARRAADLRRRAARLPDRVLPQRRHRVRRDERRGAGGARAPRRAGDRQRAPLPPGAPARRSRRAHRAAQPPLLPRDAGARGRPRPPLQPQPRARRVRPRRLQGDQRPDRPSLRRRGAGRGLRPRPRRRPLGGRRLPRRRRRVRGDPARVVGHGRRPAVQAARARRLRQAGRAGGPAAPLGRRHRAAARGRRRLVLRARRRGALPRQGRRQGHGGRRRLGDAPPARGTAERQATRSPRRETARAASRPPSRHFRSSLGLLLFVERRVDLGNLGRLAGVGRARLVSCRSRRACRRR